MKQIPLTKGKFALVDDEDYDRLMAIGKWQAMKNRNTFYAQTTIRRGGKRYTTMMHRVVMCAKSGVMIDHKFGDGLDNRKENLRVCSSQQNAVNQKIRSTNSSGHKGVHWKKSNSKWMAQITVNFKKIYLGYFACPIDAARAYNEAATKYHGEFAKLNQVPA